MASSQPRRSPLAMAVLIILAHEPLHPYGLRQRIRDWGKDSVVNVSQRNAIYQIMERLERAGLIAVRETSRNEKRPERTIYETTPAGQAMARQWLLEMLSTPTREYPEFPAALAFIGDLPHEDKLRVLEERAKILEQDIGRLASEVDASVAEVPGGVERIYLVEVEYMQAVWQAELKYVHQLVDDLRAGKLD
jgi:DNA-binding PadR family transcriptional regulator